jgi:ribosomal protein S4
MRHPSYLLNPGDMFSVDPDRVLWATSGGAKSEAIEEEPSTEATSSEANALPDAAKTPSEEEDDPRELDPEWEDLTEHDIAASKRSQTPPPTDEQLKTRKHTIKQLHALTLDAESDYSPSAKEKIALRAVRRSLKRLMSKARTVSAQDIDDVADELSDVVVRIESRQKAGRSRAPAAAAAAEGSASRGAGAATRQEVNPHLLALGEVAATQKGLWKPKDYMAPFVFVPRYLEVNHTVCSAVYLRHPVVRGGAAEVPSPFTLETGSLAFAWYLRRR